MGNSSKDYILCAKKQASIGVVRPLLFYLLQVLYGTPNFLSLSFAKLLPYERNSDDQVFL